MDIKELQRQEKTKVCHIRIPISKSEWLKEKNVSPTKVLNKSIEELMKAKE